jgi:hypothetical protein
VKRIPLGESEGGKTMASAGRDYCDFLFGELKDIKGRLDSALSRSGEHFTDESVSSHLRDIENVLEWKLDMLGKCCPEWKEFGEQRTSVGHIKGFHPEEVPYGQTPL